MDQTLMTSPSWSPDADPHTASDHEDFETEKPQDVAVDDEEQAAASRRSRKGKRNKPTLNCKECVDRKTKCDRSRPKCLSWWDMESCLLHHNTYVLSFFQSSSADNLRLHESECKTMLSDVSIANGNGKRLKFGWCVNTHFQVADILAATGGSRPRKRSSHIDFNRPAVPLAQSSITSNIAFDIPSMGTIRPTHHQISPAFNSNSNHHSTRLPTADSPSIQRERFTLFPRFEAKQHPFGNYWTFEGGLVELVGVLPSKQQADVLVEAYFECVDPLYPVVNRVEFIAEYERFWNMPLGEQCESDPCHLALCFIMFAIGTKCTEQSPARNDSAEFYVSACHQCLCVSSYLSRATLKTVQTMILLCYYLISNNHISDAWTFSGMLQRQVYGLGLNLDPEVHHPDANFAEKQLRARVFWAALFIDTSLSLYCEVPPSMMCYDIDSSSLQSMSMSPQIQREDASTLDIFSGFPATNQRDSEQNDINFMTTIWQCVQFGQSHLCVPRALRRAVCTDVVHKAKLIAEFRALYATWASPFNSTNPSRFDGWDNRLTRQTIAASSIYYWILTTLMMDSNETSGVESDFDGALEAAHEGLTAFFAMVRLSPSQADSWSAHHTRAFDQATIIGNILAAQEMNREAGRMLAKSDLERYIDILLRARGCVEFEALRMRRLAELETLRLSIKHV